ncbi:MAG: PAS-domain containing protein [Pseudomonadota bacterium]
MAWGLIGGTVAVAAMLTVLVLFVVYRRPFPIAAPSETQGAVVVIQSGRVVDASAPARLTFGAEIGIRPEEFLRDMLGTGAGPALRAFRLLQAMGTQMRLVVRDRHDRGIEMIGEPVGGQLHLMLKETEAPEKLDDTMLSGADLEGQTGGFPVATIDRLLEGAPLIAWSRRTDGKLEWASGQVSSESTVLMPAQVVDMVVARSQFDGEIADPVRRTRLEFGDDEPTSLHAVEIDGPGDFISGFAVDASVAASVERTLTRFIQTMTETFAHLTVGLAIFDQNHRLVLFNPAVAEMWGIDAVWLARRPQLREILDRLRSNRRLPERGDYHAWRDKLLGLFADPDAVNYEESWDLASGVRYRVMARPHPHGALAFVFDDVTEQVQLETRYRHMDDLLTRALERLDEGLIVFGADGLLRYVNSAFHEIFGTDEELVGPGRHARDVFGLCARLSIEADPWQEAVEFTTGASERSVRTWEVTLADDRSVRLRFAPLPGASTLVVFTDISDSENAARALRDRSKALEAAEAMRGAVLDGISQKLRTPLNSIFGLAQLLRETSEKSNSPEQDRLAEGILEAARNLLESVTDVSDLASFEVGNPDPAREQITFGAMVGVTEQILAARTSAAEVKLTTRIDEVAGQIPGATLPLRQLLFYLAADAIQRAKPGYRITLGIEVNDAGAAELFVEETALDGEGPDPQTVQRTSPVLPLARRLALDAGATVSMRALDSGTGMRAICHLPDYLPNVAEKQLETG